MLARIALVVLAVVGAGGVRADAHPLGNFTSNHLSRISVGARAVEVHYVLDDAEIPTFALLRALDPHGRPAAGALAGWARSYAQQLIPQLQLSIGGRPTQLRFERSSVRLRPGAGGLAILYFTADYAAPRPAGALRLDYADATLPGRIGWKDVVVSPQREPTDELRAYPNALLGSPRDRTSATIDVAASGAVTVADAGPGPLGLISTQRMNDLSDVLGRDLADPLVLGGALLLAIVLGALHALEPGHGKTLLAVSLVGARATVPQAAILATSLTLAHTCGVLIFGALILLLTRAIVPEAIYPWIALGSGALVAVLGARALATALARRTPSGAHVHAHHHHHHGDHDHDHGPAHTHAIQGSAPLRFRDTLLAAASGNVAPCPAALVVLLAAIATDRVGWGMVLIVAFSVGLALTLTALGIAVVKGAGWLVRRPQFDRAARYAPLLTAGAISLIGAWMIGEAVAAQALVPSPFPVAGAILVAIAAFALYPLTKETRCNRSSA